MTQMLGTAVFMNGIVHTEVKNGSIHRALKSLYWLKTADSPKMLILTIKMSIYNVHSSTQVPKLGSTGALPLVMEPWMTL